MKSVIFSIVGKSKKTTRKKITSILNDYAINIDCANSLWCAKISMSGIEQVKNKLSMLPLKNISIVCMNGDNIIFRVGKKKKTPIFDYDVKDVINYFDVLQFICVLASAFHDLGKFNNFFQSKLKKSTPSADPFRHEYVSCKIIEALVNLNPKWYNDFLLNKTSTSDIESYFKSQFDNNTIHRIHTEKFSIVEKLICYLILSHHRLPTPNITLITDISSYLNFDNAIQELSKDDLGYNNTNVSFDLKERQKECFLFSRGISLIHVDAIDKEFSRNLITRISQQLNNFNEVKNKLTKLIENPQNIHLLLHIARNVLMLADHKFSSTSSININTERNMSICYANTKEQFSENKNKYIKVYNQTLIEHLYGVSKTAEEILQWIPFFKDKMPYTTNKYIQETTDNASYYWQQKVCNVIKNERANDKVFFVCNVASTGKGKTVANAKMMNAISNRLRYNLCVGLTTLVEQTTKSYKQIGFNEENLCMCIGADEKEDLHKIFDSDDFNKSEYDLDSISSSSDLLYKQNYMEEEYNQYINEKYFDVLFGKTKNTNKYSNFLWKPILVCTIDFLMNITQVIKGSKHLLPSYRLMSSDLVIDEIDDFSIVDLRAILSLAYMTGMYGKNLIISSATISPYLAKCFQRAHLLGLNSYNLMFGSNYKNQQCIICDENNAVSASSNNFDEKIVSFMKKRITFLKSQPIRRKWKIALIPNVTSNADANIFMFNHTIKDSIVELHNDNHLIDKTTNKKVSIGCVRINNVNPCVAVTKFLTTQSDDKHDVFVMAYHSRQILLVREVQEDYLQSVLNRKGQPIEGVFDFSLDKRYETMYTEIKNSKKENVVFVLVATAVEEVGRDHDFDWCVIEPSSLRSVVQMCGRVHRHREQTQDITHNNVHILQYNVNFLSKPNNKLCFVCPCVESPDNNIVLSSKNAIDLFEQEFLDNISSIQCIDTYKISEDNVTTKFHLEEQWLYKTLLQECDNNSYAYSFYAYSNTYSYLTGMHQSINKFRKQKYEEHDVIINEDYNFFFIDTKDKNKIKSYTATQFNKTRPCYPNLWVKKDYKKYLLDTIQKSGILTIEECAMKYGGISFIPSKNSNRTYFYDDDMGIYYTK
jgi:CRISPR-associated helicase cas3